MQKKWKSFKEAQKYAISTELKGQKEWKEYAKSGKLPDDIPRSPYTVYKDKGWDGFGDWLGTGTIASQNRIYRPFTEARKFARSLELKNSRAWIQYCKSTDKPIDLPRTAYLVYKNHGWKGWGDFLGTGNKRTSPPPNHQWKPFEEARKFARSLKLKNSAEWVKYYKSVKKPPNIPLQPRAVYKNQGWKGWGDFLGTRNVRPGTITYQPFTEARKFVRSLNLSNQKEWYSYCHSGQKPDNIPTTPNYIYKDNGWEGLGDWLGSGTTAPFNREYRPFKDARKFIRSLGLKNEKPEWREYCKSGIKPKDIPTTPQRIYKDKGWNGMADWLGTERPEWAPYQEARQFVHSLNLKSTREWERFCRSKNKPEYIPKSPDTVYKDKGWNGTADWLGARFKNFTTARKFVRSLNLKNSLEWRRYSSSGERPNDIPANPWKFYKDDGWKGICDWIGSDYISNYHKTFLPFNEARDCVRSLHLPNYDTWVAYCTSNEKPDNIPSNPQKVYKDDGWNGTSDWLGNGNTRTRHIKDAEKIDKLYKKYYNLHQKYSTYPDSHLILNFAMVSMLDVAKMGGKMKRDYIRLISSANAHTGQLRVKDHKYALSLFKDIITAFLIDFPEYMETNWKYVYEQCMIEIKGWGCR